jgi:adenine-specific DNA methylase
MHSAALASSIFLVARKRERADTGNFEEAVKPELEQIVRERVEALWAMGISGADLEIAPVGAGLRAFTRFARVEYANGEEVPAERFLTEVKTVVLETILERLAEEAARDRKEHKEEGGSTRSLRSLAARTALSGLDAPTRFYLLWRYTCGAAELERQWDTDSKTSVPQALRQLRLIRNQQLTIAAGDIIQQVEEATAFVQRNTRMAVKIEGKLERSEKWEYPLKPFARP